MDLSFTSSIVQERMMRVGIEARCGSKGLILNDQDWIYELAVKSLKEDNKFFKRTNVSTNMQKLFALQIEKFGGIFYFLLEDQGKLQVIRTSDLSELEGKYEGALHGSSAMPRLRKIS